MALPLQIPVLEYSTRSESWEPFETSNLQARAQSAHSPGKRELKIVTWNIWFDMCSMPPDRWIFLFATVFAGPEVLDVVAMQEVRAESWDLLLHAEEVRKDWLVVDYKNMAKEMRSWYGTTMLIRKGWLEESGFDALTAAMVHFPTSQGRALLVLEMKDEQDVALRIATSHFESMPEDEPLRLRQFKIAGNTLTLPRSSAVLDAMDNAPADSSHERPSWKSGMQFFKQGVSMLRGDHSNQSPPAVADAGAPHVVLVGDTNIYHVSELSPLFEAPFEFSDAYALGCNDEATSKGRDDDGDVLATDDHTFGMTFPSQWGTKKIDYILFRPGDHSMKMPITAAADPPSSDTDTDPSTSSMRVVKAALLGNEPIPEKSFSGGRDGKLYASDHLGVFVWFKGL